jgi:chromosome segregation ATPase
MKVKKPKQTAKQIREELEVMRAENATLRATISNYKREVEVANEKSRLITVSEKEEFQSKIASAEQNESKAIENLEYAKRQLADLHKTVNGLRKTNLELNGRLAKAKEIFKQMKLQIGELQHVYKHYQSIFKWSYQFKN